MATANPPSDPPGPSPEPGPGAPSLEEFRSLASAAAARIPADALPRAPVSPEAIRDLAAEIAAAVLHEMTAPVDVASGSEVQGFLRVGYECTGAAYSCTVSYSCGLFRPHKCANTFTCPGLFSSPSIQRVIR